MPKINQLGIPTGLLKRDNPRRELQKVKKLGLGVIEVHPDWSRHLELVADSVPEFSAHVTSSDKSFARKALKLGASRLILHPTDLDGDPFWNELGERLLIENLDPNHPSWRDADSLSRALEKVPKANICFDIAHTTGDASIASSIVKMHSARIKQVHFSEINPKNGAHLANVSSSAMTELKWLSLLPAPVPVIIELQAFIGWDKTLSVLSQLISLESMR